MVEERVRIPWRGGAVQLPLSAALAVLLVPGLLWLASLHPALAALTFLLLLPALFLVAVRCIVKHKPKTKFFVRWSAVTAAYLLYVYEVVPQKVPSEGSQSRRRPLLGPSPG